MDWQNTPIAGRLTSLRQYELDQVRRVLSQPCRPLAARHPVSRPDHNIPALTAESGKQPEWLGTGMPMIALTHGFLPWPQ